jgi:hypothetical protein
VGRFLVQQEEAEEEEEDRLGVPEELGVDRERAFKAGEPEHGGEDAVEDACGEEREYRARRDLP